MVPYGAQLTAGRSLLSFNELIIQFIPADPMTVSAAGESTSVDVIPAKGAWIREAFLKLNQLIIKKSSFRGLR